MLGYADQGENNSPASTPLDGTDKPVGDEAGKYLARSRLTILGFRTASLIWTLEMYFKLEVQRNVSIQPPTAESYLVFALHLLHFGNLI